MRRGEMAVLFLFALGAIMWLLPAQSDRAAPSPEPEAAWMPAAAESARSLPSPPDYAPAGDREITLDSYSLDPEAASRLKLPERLKEISGLALTSDGRLLAHNDEEGIIFEIDPAKGEVRKLLELSDSRGRLDADFEGIAVTEEHIYLVTSDGRLCEALAGGTGDRAPCLIYDTRLGSDYEIEGLAYEPGTRELLLASKAARGGAAKGPLYIFRWSVDTKRMVEGGQIRIPVKEIASRIPGKDFETSGIERHPVSGNYFLVAGRQRALAEITPDGTLVGVRELPAGWHRQTEGITFGLDCSLILSDEGASKRARLTVYPLRPL